MNKKRIIFVLTIILFIIGISIFQTDITKGDVPEGWFSFVIPSEFPENSMVDLSNVFNESPAGSHGYLNRDGGYFRFDNGVRAKFWGGAGYGIISKEEAEIVAKRYKAVGINLTRLHGLDEFYTNSNVLMSGILEKNPSIADDQLQVTQNISEEALDKLDYYIYQMKLNGIYTDIILTDRRKFTEADGVTDASELASWAKYEIAGCYMFDPRMIELNKKFAADLLNHHNPYTGLYYKEDPAIAIVEIENEHTIRPLSSNDRFDYLSYPEHEHIPDYYLDQLDNLWNGWLEEKYNSVENVLSAWSFATSSEELTATSTWALRMNNGCIATSSEITNGFNINISSSGDRDCVLLRHRIDVVKDNFYKISFTASSSPEKWLTLLVPQTIGTSSWAGTNNLYRDVAVEENDHDYEIYFVGKDQSTDEYFDPISIYMGDTVGNLKITNISLTKISGIDVEENEYAGGFNFKRPEYEYRQMYPEARMLDLMEFYQDIQKSHIDDMNNYLKNDIGYSGLTVGTNFYTRMTDSYANQGTDFSSVHSYWDYVLPRISPTQTYMYNDSIFDDRLGINPIIDFSKGNIYGMPFFATEWNSYNFNPYDYEFSTMMPIYSSFLDFDGVAIHAFNSFRNIPEDENVPRLMQLDSYSDPQKTSLLLAGSLIFRNQMIATSTAEIILPMSDSDVLQESLLELENFFTTNESRLSDIEFPSKFNLNNLIPFQSRVTIDFSDDPTPPLPEILDTGNIWSDTGEILFSTSSRRMIADNEKVNVFLGNSSGGVNMSHMDIMASEEGTVFLVPLDNKNLSESNKILLLAVSESRNTDQSCSLTEELDGPDLFTCNAGIFPTLFKDMDLSLTLKGLDDNLNVYSLNEAGAINEEINFASGLPGEYSFDFPDETIWCVLTSEDVSPFANIIIEDDLIKEGENINFTAEIIRGTANIINYVWNFGDGTTANGLEQTHAFSNAGNYEVGLTVYDENSLSFTATTSIAVHPINSSPVFTDLASTSVNVGENIKFLVRADDPDNPNLFPNSSFEEDTEYWSEDWIIAEQSWYTPAIVSDESILGEKSAFFEPKYEGIGSTIQSEEYLAIKPETDYNFQFLAKGENILIGSPLWHRLVAVGKWYDNFYNTVGITEYIYLNSSLESSFDWKLVSPTKTSPIDASYFKITFLGIPRTGTGKGWIDAIEMKKADGDQASYSATNLPTSASFNESSGIFSWTPAAVGSYDIIFTATDGSASTSKEITITVQKPCEDDADCNDGLYCTNPDVCVAGVCQNTARDCSDGISCTTDSCDEDVNTCVHTADDAFCDDGLYCNGVETCDLVLGCQNGSAINCSANNISTIAGCYYNPDGIDYTWDYRAGFTSVCAEEEDSCTTGNENIAHTCNKLTCGAECEEGETNTGEYYCDDQIVKYDNYLCSLNDCSFQYESSTEIRTCSGLGENDICWDGSNSCNHCDDGIDNDGDGCVDSIDSDCGGRDTTNDGVDDNCNGFIDEDYVRQQYTGMGWSYPNPINNIISAPSIDEPIEGDIETEEKEKCIFDCAKTTFILYIINPNGVARETYSNFVKIDRFGNNIFQFNFEDSGNDFDYNDLIIRVDKSNCNKIVVTPTNLDAGWHHQIWIKLLYEGTIKKDLLLWSDSHTAIGVSKEINLSDHYDLCLGAEITAPSSTTTVLNVDPYNDTSFKGRVRGKLLLQVEDRGRIWYVDPASDLRYEVTRENAMDLFRSLSLGITNSDLYKIPINQGLNNRDNLELRLRVRGRILLQVEAQGRTWYVIPGELRRVQVTSVDLYDIFRNYSLGITNADLEMIPGGDLSQDLVEKANPVPIDEPVIKPSVCATSINFNTDLSPGDNNNQVLELQKLLKCLGYFPADVVANGNFGPTTTASVQQFQIANNISPTGNVGPLTREILNRY